MSDTIILSTGLRNKLARQIKKYILPLENGTQTVTNKKFKTHAQVEQGVFRSLEIEPTIEAMTGKFNNEYTSLKVQFNNNKVETATYTRSIIIKASEWGTPGLVEETISYNPKETELPNALKQEHPDIQTKHLYTRTVKQIYHTMDGNVKDRFHSFTCEEYRQSITVPSVQDIKNAQFTWKSAAKIIGISAAAGILGSAVAIWAVYSYQKQTQNDTPPKEPAATSLVSKEIPQLVTRKRAPRLNAEQHIYS